MSTARVRQGALAPALPWRWVPSWSGAAAALPVLVALVTLAAFWWAGPPGPRPWSADRQVQTVAAAVGWIVAARACGGVRGMRVAAGAWWVGGLLLVVSAAGGTGAVPAGAAQTCAALAGLAVVPFGVVSVPRPLPASLAVAVGAALAGFAVLGTWGSAFWLGAVDDGGGVGISVTVALVVAATLGRRFAVGSSADRRTLLWLTLGLAVVVLVEIPLGFVPSGPGTVVVGGAAQLVVPASVVVGVVRPDVADARVVAARVAAGATTALVALAVFQGLVALTVVATGGPAPMGVQGLAVVVAAAVFHPVRSRLDGAFDRLFRGQSVDPVDAAVRFGAGLSTSDDPVVALRALRDALWLPYAALVDAAGATVSASGHVPAEGTVALPLRVLDHDLGSLVVGLRPGDSAPSRQDAELLRIVVPALAQAVQARSLAEDLRASRERVVTAVEDDRRRLRGDLHDGLGPTLTGVAYAADAAGNLVRSDPAAAQALLADLRSDVGAAILEVRRLVDGLRPATLDELGLVDALRRHTTHLASATGGRLDVRLLADEIPALSAAVEGRLLLVEVADGVCAGGDGVVASGEGAPVAAWAPGVGLTSMRERAELLGGTFTVRAVAGGGAVRALLPLG